MLFVVPSFHFGIKKIPEQANKKNTCQIVNIFAKQTGDVEADKEENGRICRAINH